MLRFLSEQRQSWADYREMSQDWARVLARLPPTPSTTGVPTVPWYASGKMPLRRRWIWIEDCPSIEVTKAERRGLLPERGAQAVDFSSGVGRNALYLLKRGLHVRSIAYSDADGTQCAFQRKWADRYQLAHPGCGSIDVVPGEFARYDLGSTQFDLVVCVNSLMYASMAIGREAILSLQRKTAVGGLHLITTYTVADSYHGRAAVNSDSFVTSGRAGDDELQCLYPASEWEHFGSSPGESFSRKDKYGRRRERSVVVAKKRAGSVTM